MPVANTEMAADICRTNVRNMINVQYIASRTTWQEFGRHEKAAVETGLLSPLLPLVAVSNQLAMTAVKINQI